MGFPLSDCPNSKYSANFLLNVTKFSQINEKSEFAISLAEWINPTDGKKFTAVELDQVKSLSSIGSFHWITKLGEQNDTRMIATDRHLNKCGQFSEKAEKKWFYNLKFCTLNMYLLFNWYNSFGAVLWKTTIQYTYE